VQDLGPIIASLAFFGLAGAVLLGPIGRALAERIRGRLPERVLDTGEVDALREELAGLRQQVGELAERQDFAERLLGQARERGLLNAPKERPGR